MIDRTHAHSTQHIPIKHSSYHVHEAFILCWHGSTHFIIFISPHTHTHTHICMIMFECIHLPHCIYTTPHVFRFIIMFFCIFMFMQYSNPNPKHVPNQIINFLGIFQKQSHRILLRYLKNRNMLQKQKQKKKSRTQRTKATESF